MTSAVMVPKGRLLASAGFLVLAVLSLAMERWAKGSLAAIAVSYLLAACGLILFSLRVRAGYLYRKPYWTWASWQRFLRLAALPLAALIVMLTITYFLDPSQSTFGAPRSATRAIWATLLLSLVLVGVWGLTIAVEWLGKGEPSEQFTRTRWFRRRGSSPIAD